MRSELVASSQFLSLVLRHRPDSIGLVLDPAGWTDVAELVARACAAGRPFTVELVRRIVAENEKQRFALSPDGLRIRANQGHSVEVELGLPPAAPPQRLFHGTARRFIGSIFTAGLLPGKRRHVHLSTDVATALIVGRRHGEPAILGVDAGRLHDSGAEFFLAENGVWLTAHVPPEYLVELPADSTG